MKFQPGTFIELDDLRGGRRVAIVGRDGITCFDSMDIHETTPHFLHPVFEPVVLGTLIGYAKKNGLMHALRDLTELCGHLNSLQVMQVLWCAQQRMTEGNVSWSPELVLAAVEDAKDMQQHAALLHLYAAHYVAATGTDA